MKLTIIGAAGVRTPLIVDEIIRRQDILGITELSLLDINAEKLNIIHKVALAGHLPGEIKFKITSTTDKSAALLNADYVITTFRVGDIASRVIDELVPLEMGILGQETTGPGGFAMGLRTIPVLADYTRLMKQVCPNAWLINFANPSGMMTEALINYLDFPRSIGICDGPSSALELISSILRVPTASIEAQYFGLNHLGWFKSINLDHVDLQPQLIQMLLANPSAAPLKIDSKVVAALQMIPNEYLYYYYHSRQAVEEIQKAGETRGQIIEKMNNSLFEELKDLIWKAQHRKLRRIYTEYISQRSESYYANKDSYSKLEYEINPELSSQIGYAELALDLIEALSGGETARLIINIPNNGSIIGMGDKDIVEIPAQIGRNSIIPMNIGAIPDHCLGLMKQIKSFEKLTIEAAISASRQKAVAALTIHPLVSDYQVAGRILDGYSSRHGDYFPNLK